MKETTLVKKLQSHDKSFSLQIHKGVKLGSGGFGECFLAYDLGKKKKVAVKVLKNTPDKTQWVENKILSQLSLSGNQNIIDAYGMHVFSSSNFYIVMEYCNMGTLKDVMEEYKKLKKNFQENEINQIAKDILAGYRALVESGIVHEDIKPSNILINDNIFKIGDFGLAIKVGDEYRKVRGTKSYIPLQKFRVKEEKKHASYLSDIYSLGIILFELVYQSHPYRGNQFQRFCENKRKELGLTSKEVRNFYNYEYLMIADIEKPERIIQAYSQALLIIIDRMISLDQKKRPDFEEIYEFFSKRPSIRKNYTKKTCLENSFSDDHLLTKSVIKFQEIKKSFFFLNPEQKYHTAKQIVYFVEKRRYLIKHLDKLWNPIRKAYEGKCKIALRELKYKLLKLCLIISKNTYDEFRQMRKRLPKQQVSKFHKKQNQCIINLLLDDLKTFKGIIRKDLDLKYQQSSLMKLTEEINEITKIMLQQQKKCSDTKIKKILTFLSRNNVITDILKELDSKNEREQQSENISSPFQEQIIQKYMEIGQEEQPPSSGWMSKLKGIKV